jgi:hypothetical protein
MSNYLKVILLFTLLLPARFIAQVQDDSLIYQHDILDHKIKTVTITTLFINNRDPKPDTATTETRSYDMNGRLLQVIYHVSIDKNNYTKRTDYFYNDNGKLRRIIYNGDNTLTDSIVYFSAQHYVEYKNSTGQRVQREVNGEDISETKISGKDTIVRKWKFVQGNDRAQVVIKDGKYERTDTTYLYDNNGNHTMMMIDKYDSLNRLVNTDYYNYKFYNSVMYSACYNDRLNMTIYSPKSKNGKSSYSVSRKYGANGLLAEKKIVPAKKQNRQSPVIVMELVYSYY